MVALLAASGSGALCLEFVLDATEAARGPETRRCDRVLRIDAVVESLDERREGVKRSISALPRDALSRDATKLRLLRDPVATPVPLLRLFCPEV